MLVLTLRTDKPESEIALFLDSQPLAQETWQAHRKLAETLHTKIQQLLKQQNKSWQEIEAVVVFIGPGSFTGLRIGISVANALVYSLGLPIVGTKGEKWQSTGLQRLKNGEDDKLIVPEYGTEAFVTQPKK